MPDPVLVGGVLVPVAFLSLSRSNKPLLPQGVCPPEQEKSPKHGCSSQKDREPKTCGFRVSGFFFSEKDFNDELRTQLQIGCTVVRGPGPRFTV